MVFLAPYLCSDLVNFNSVSTKGKNGGPIRPRKKRWSDSPHVKKRWSNSPQEFWTFDLLHIFQYIHNPLYFYQKRTTVLKKEIKNKTFLKSRKRQKSLIMCYLIKLCSATYFVIFLAYFLFFVFQKLLYNVHNVTSHVKSLGN